MKHPRCALNLAKLLEIDGAQVLRGWELNAWQTLCAYQVEHHPDLTMREMFNALGKEKDIRKRKVQAACAFAIANDTKV